MIGIKTYKLYCKYDGQTEWESDSTRNPKPNDVWKNISKEFNIIELIFYNFYKINSNLYSKELENEMQLEIDAYKSKVTEELFEYLKQGKKLFPNLEPHSKKKGFLKRLFALIKQ